MRKRLFLLMAVLLLALTACGGQTPSASPAGENGEPETSGSGDSEKVLPQGDYQIKITAGDLELIGDMNDSAQSLDFAALLPMTVSLYQPADFAKAFDLPRELTSSEERTREYKIGTIACWPEGPATAIFFSDHAPQTVVPVIHIGQIDSGTENLRDYSGDILIELLPEETVADEAEPSVSTEGTQLVFSAGDVEITVLLNDLPLAQELVETLPADLTMTRLYEREYYGNSLNWDPDSAYETSVEYTPGTLAYWPRGNSLILFFDHSDEHPTMNSGIVEIGEIQTDLSVFDSLSGTEEMTISVVD